MTKQDTATWSERTKRAAKMSALTIVLTLAGTSAAQEVHRGTSELPLEVRLVETASIRGSIVCVGDLAEITGASTSLVQQVAQLELFPTPTTARRIQAREIAERLALRGLDPFRYQMTGQTSVLVQPATHEESFAVRPVDYREQVRPQWQETTYREAKNEALESATQRIKEAVLETLRTRVGANVHWEITVELNPRDAARLADASTQFTLQGLRHPWLGSHEAKLQLLNDSDYEQIPVSIDIQSNTLVVTAKSPIGMGDVIQAEHLELVPLASRPSYDDLVYRLEDVIGKESTRAIRVGENVRSSTIRAQVIVHRNEIVECFAVHGGVRAVTTVKALQDGSVGSLIQVEKLDRSAKYAARVTGPQQVEVFTGSSGRSDIKSFGR